MSALRTPEQIAKAARTRAITRRIGLLFGAAELVAKRAGALELHAAKNAAAGYDRGASNKLARAKDLRRIANFLVDSRLHRLIRENDALLELLLADPPDGAYMRPRRVDMAAVMPSKPWGAGRRRFSSEGNSYC